MKKIKKIILAVIGILAAIILYFYIDYRLIKVDGRNASEFEKRLISAISADDNVDIKEVTPFVWDIFYYFRAYTPPKHMYEKTGARWTNNNTFIGYLLLNDFEKEMLNDGLYALIFLNKGKVVCHYTGQTEKFDIRIESQDGVKAENSFFYVSLDKISGNVILAEGAQENALINQLDGESYIINSIVNYYGNTSDPVLIYEKISFEDGTLVLAEKLSDGEHYPDLHYIDSRGKLTYLTRGSYCWTLNYTRINGYNIFFGLSGIEKRATVDDPVPKTKPVKLVEAVFSDETVSITPAENVYAHINPKEKDSRVFNDPKGYILLVRGWKMPYNFSAVLEGGEKVSLSKTAIDYGKEYMPDYLKMNKEDIYNSYAFTFSPMLTPAEWKQGYEDGEILLEGKTDANRNRNTLFLRASGNMLLTHSFIVPQDIKSFYLSNNSVRSASFSPGETVKVVCPQNHKLLDCRKGDTGSGAVCSKRR